MGEAQNADIYQPVRLIVRKVLEVRRDLKSPVEIAELKIGAYGESQMAERELYDFVEILQDVSPWAIKGKGCLQCRCETIPMIIRVIRVIRVQ